MLASLLQWADAHFYHPWVLLHLPLVGLVWWRWGRGAGGRPRVWFSSVDAMLNAPRTWAARCGVLLPILRALALALLIVCVARPRKGNELTRVDTEGIAIQLVIDRSGSMAALDFRLDGRQVDRLAAVKRVVKDFVLGAEELPGRPDDLIGAITFARFADSICPLTLGHDFLVESLQQTTFAPREEDGTAVGDALALGVERLRALEELRGLRPDRRIKSKIVILLTDGENNCGDIEPLKAAEIAKTLGIKVYTIGAGTRGMAQFPVTDPFTGQRVYRPMMVNIDEGTLKRIAEQTGGKYFRATDTESLTKIYAEIDRLEKTRTEERRYMEYKELATQWVRIGPIDLPPLLAVVFLLIATEIVLAQTWLRRTP